MTTVYEVKIESGVRWVLFSTLDGVALSDRERSKSLFEAGQKVRVGRNTEFTPKKSKAKLGDLSQVGYSPYLCFSARAKAVIGPRINSLGRWLELDCEEAPYWLFDVTNVVDALDEQQSELLRFDSGEVMRIVRFAFDSERVQSQMLFKIPQVSSHNLVTQEFVDLVKNAGLTAFHFKPIWDWELGSIDSKSARSTARVISDFERRIRHMSDRTLTAEELAQVSENADHARARLDIADPQAEPDAVVRLIDSYVDTYQAERRHEDQRSNCDLEQERLAVELGSAWGRQFVRRFNWQWLSVHHDKGDEWAVVSPDRSLIVYPIHFIRACLLSSEIDCSAMLVFNMLGVGTIPTVAPGSLTDLMLAVRRLVPK